MRFQSLLALTAAGALLLPMAATAGDFPAGKQATSCLTPPRGRDGWGGGARSVKSSLPSANSES